MCANFGFGALDRLQQHVPLPSERQLDDASSREMVERERHLLVGDRDVVHFEPAALDVAARLAVRRYEAGLDKGREHAEAGFELRARALDRGQRLGESSFLEGAARGL